MESQKIKLLLEKYWNGNSSVEEETLLKRHFKNEVPKEEQRFQPVFDYASMVEKQESEFKLDFLDDIIEEKRNFSFLKWNPKLKWSSGIAAAILVMVLSVNYQWKDMQPIIAQEDAALNSAYEETIYALTLLSEKLNQGNASIFELSTFDKTKKQILNENL